MVLIIDEIKIRDDLMYDRSGSRLHGFVNLGNVNNQLLEVQQLACIVTSLTTTLLSTARLEILVDKKFGDLEKN